MDRRTLLTSLTCFIAAPAIVRASSLMPIKPLPLSLGEVPWLADDVWQLTWEDCAGVVRRKWTRSFIKDIEPIIERFKTGENVCVAYTAERLDWKLDWRGL